MNRKQKWVVVAGLAVMALMAIIPPWVQKRAGADLSVPSGYHLIFSPPTGPSGDRDRMDPALRKAISQEFGPDFSTSKRADRYSTSYSPRIDTPRLIVQWASVAFVTAAAVVLLHGTSPRKLT
jgi:hypothetical protein